MQLASTLATDTPAHDALKPPPKETDTTTPTKEGAITKPDTIEPHCVHPRSATVTRVCDVCEPHLLVPWSRSYRAQSTVTTEKGAANTALDMGSHRTPPPRQAGPARCCHTSTDQQARPLLETPARRTLSGGAHRRHHTPGCMATTPQSATMPTAPETATHLAWARLMGTGTAAALRWSLMLPQV
jgi:hypothetical protein